MTLDFILEWYGGLANATTLQKSISLQYIAPWIRNLSLFADPTHSLHNPSGLRKCVRVFIDITMQDQEVWNSSFHVVNCLIHNAFTLGLCDDSEDDLG